MLECSTLQGLWKCPKTKVASFSKTQGLSSARPTLHVGGRTFRLKGGDTCWRSVPRLTNGRGLEVCFAVKGEEGLSSRVQTPETAPVETRNEGNLVKQGKQFHQEISCQCAKFTLFFKNTSGNPADGSLGFHKVGGKLCTKSNNFLLQL